LFSSKLFPLKPPKSLSPIILKIQNPADPNFTNVFKADLNASQKTLSYTEQGICEAAALKQEGLALGLYGFQKVPGLLSQVQTGRNKNIDFFVQNFSPLGPLSVYNAN